MSMRGDMLQVVDAALGSSRKEEDKEPLGRSRKEEDKEPRPDGHRTAKFLFSFGASCLERFVLA